MEPSLTNNTTTPESKPDWDPNKEQSVVLPQVESTAPVSTEATMTSPVAEAVPAQTEVAVSQPTTEASSVQSPVAENTFTPKTYTELNEQTPPLGTKVSELQPTAEVPQTPAQEVLLPEALSAVDKQQTGFFGKLKSFFSPGKKS
jgi:hypothetical protein